MASNTVRDSFGLRPSPGLRWYFPYFIRPARCGTSGSTRCQNASDTSHEASLVFAIVSLRCAHPGADGKTEQHIIYG